MLGGNAQPCLLRVASVMMVGALFLASFYLGQSYDRLRVMDSENLDLELEAHDADREPQKEGQRLVNVTGQGRNHDRHLDSHDMDMQDEVKLEPDADGVGLQEGQRQTLVNFTAVAMQDEVKLEPDADGVGLQEGQTLVREKLESLLLPQSEFCANNSFGSCVCHGFFQQCRNEPEPNCTVVPSRGHMDCLAEDTQCYCASAMYRHCANEKEQCRCSGIIAYGVRTSWSYSNKSESNVQCTHDALDLADPLEGVKKSCLCVYVAPREARSQTQPEFFAQSALLRDGLEEIGKRRQGEEDSARRDVKISRDLKSFTLKNAVIINRGLKAQWVFDAEGKEVAAAQFRPSHHVPEPKPDEVKDLAMKSPVVVEESVYLGSLLEQFGHILIECSARFWYLFSESVEEEGRSLVYTSSNEFYREGTPLIKEAIRLLGKNPDRLLLLREHLNSTTVFSSLVIPERAWNIGIFGRKEMRGVWQRWRASAVGLTPGLPVLDAANRRNPMYFVGRFVPGSDKPPRRVPENEGEVVKLFEKRGFTFIPPTGEPPFAFRTLSEQAALYSDAVCIAAFEGSGLHNAVWMLPGSVAIGLHMGFPPSNLNQIYINVLADVHYITMPVKVDPPLTSRVEAFVTCDPSEVEISLELVWPEVVKRVLVVPTRAAVLAAERSRRDGAEA